MLLQVKQQEAYMRYMKKEENKVLINNWLAKEKLVYGGDIEYKFRYDNSTIELYSVSGTPLMGGSETVTIHIPSFVNKLKEGLFKGVCSGIKLVYTGNSIKSTYRLFENYNGKTVDLSGFNASAVIDMGYMFNSSENLESVVMECIDTSNVKNMGNMFSHAIRLRSIDISGLKTNNVEDMGSMFEGCINLLNIEIGNIDTSNVKNMQSMFQECCMLASLDLSGIDTRKVNNMNCMFNGCYALKNLDISNLSTASIYDSYGLEGMFNDTICLELDLENMDEKLVQAYRDRNI